MLNDFDNLTMKDKADRIPEDSSVLPEFWHNGLFEPESTLPEHQRLQAEYRDELALIALTLVFLPMLFGAVFMFCRAEMSLQASTPVTRQISSSDINNR
jgi:hypothetical protein